jgi:hypothetical protein
MKRPALEDALIGAENKIRLLELFFEMDNVLVEVPRSMGAENFATEGVVATLRSVADELDRARTLIRPKKVIAERRSGLEREKGGA